MPVHRAFRRRSRRGTAVALAVALSSALLFGAPGRSVGQVAPEATAEPTGYWLVATDGGIFTFGDAAFHGSTGAIRLNQPIVAMAPTPSGQGYWLVASDGGIFSFGDAAFHGSTGAIKLNKPIVTMAPTPTGKGYWLAASDGGIFTFGDAAFYGSTGAIKLNKPILAMAPTPTGKGYWLVASDGGIFTFGDAGFFGSAAGAAPTDDSVVGFAPTASGKGYWEAFSSGRVLAFGDAADLGSARGLNVPVVGMAATPGGAGYWLVASDGGIFTFGDARFFGSTGAIRLNQPIVGLAPRRVVAATTPTLPASPDPASVPPGATDPDPDVTPIPPTPIGPQAARYPTDPDGQGPEPIGEPMLSPFGGMHYEDIPATPNDCGFPYTATGTVLPDETDFVGEASGMVLSRRYPGVYWTVRDSGHTAAINATRIAPDGMAVAKEILVDNATNGDWEEVNYTIGPDGQARLWVVDNGGQNGARKIYEILEPDPDAVTHVQAVNAYPWQYPDRSHNTEASFMSRGYLVVVSKETPHANMYRFETLTPGVMNTPTYIGQLGNSKDVSVVRQSPDGQLLISVSHELLHLYRSTDGTGSLKSFGGRLPDCEFKAFAGEHIEAGEFSANREMQFIDEIKKTFRLQLAP